MIDSQHLNEEQLSSYLDQRLEQPGLQRAEAHLASCHSCREGLESLRRTVGLLRALSEVEPPRSFVIPVALRPLRAPSGSRSLAQRLVPWTRATGALAALFFVVLMTVDITGAASTPAARAPASASTEAAKPASSRALEAAPALSPDQSSPKSDGAGAAPQAAPAASGSGASQALRSLAPTAELAAPRAAVSAPVPESPSSTSPLRPWEVLSGGLGAVLLLSSVLLARMARRRG